VTGIIRGIASHYGRRYGPQWLALPEGPGIRVQVCAVGCIKRVSNDAGPDLAMQRKGRVVDLSWHDFQIVCGVAEGAPDPGLCRVTIEREP
jgi:hypothetical protein